MRIAGYCGTIRLHGGDLASTKMPNPVAHVGLLAP